MEPFPSLPTFSVVDVETSGLSADHDRILQVGVVTWQAGAITNEWQSLVRLPRPWHRVGPHHVHHIRRRHLWFAPPEHTVLHTFAALTTGTVLTAHNMQFDWAFLSSACRANDIPLTPTNRLCTLGLSRKLDPTRTRSHRLSDVAERYGVVNANAHNALDDARATAEVLPYLLSAHNITTESALSAFYER